MEIVSANTDRELDEKAALGEVSGSLQDLAANLMRIARGAGRPYDLVREAARFVVAMDRHFDAANRYPLPNEITGMLTYEAPVGQSDTDYARQAIIDGSLQVAASRLLGQKLQLHAGEKQMDRGVREIADLREQKRAAWLAQERALRMAERAKASPKKRKAIKVQRPQPKY